MRLISASPMTQPQVICNGCIDRIVIVLLLSYTSKTMAAPPTSKFISKASLPLRALRNSRRASQRPLVGLRAFHQVIKSPTPAVSYTRPRLPADKSKLQPFYFPGRVAGGIRNIFIQTENTPNADVSSINLYDHFPLLIDYRL